MTARIRAFAEGDEPVRYDEEMEVYVVSSHEAARTVLSDAGFVTDRLDSLLPRLGGFDELPSLLNAMLQLFMDGPAHDRFRLAVSRDLAPKRVGEMRPRIGAIVDAALDGVADRPVFDVVADVAYPVTIGVIAELLDIGVAGARALLGFASRIFTVLELRPTEQQLLDAGEAVRGCALFLLPFLPERRANPGRDLISSLATLELDGEPLPAEELLTMIVQILIAGHEPPAHLIVNGALSLLGHPAELRRMRDKPGLAASAVEEVLRLDSPIAYLSRTATRDVVLAGTPIREGEQVVVDMVAANRDPDRYDDPDRFDILRPDPGHISFGGGGHYCIGRALGRVEAEETLRRLFARFPDLALADEDLTRRPSATFHALDRLPVRRGKTS
ncbi:cytochrome P450 [Actinomadura roseirufa]|uniref:cytochrome P450 n=1 Tax=Actinomadura roseirufa TaxID=2094049 RepID=UPI001040F4C4|nr:cytochrome P450 [Actinomadura roseirufa]